MSNRPAGSLIDLEPKLRSQTQLKATSVTVLADSVRARQTYWNCLTESFQQADR